MNNHRNCFVRKQNRLVVAVREKTKNATDRHGLNTDPRFRTLKMLGKIKIYCPRKFRLHCLPWPPVSTAPAFVHGFRTIS